MRKLFDDRNREIENDIRSNDVTEILGQAPSWVIRWGITFVLLIVVILFVGAAMIQYDDVIPARITITTLEPPIHIKSRSSGKIAEFYVEAGQNVIRDEELAIIENTATKEDVIFVKNLIYHFKPEPINLDSIYYFFPLTLSLGELQSAYSKFVSQYQNFLLYSENQPNRTQAKLLSNQIEQQEKLLERQEYQLLLFMEELSLSRIAFKRNVSLLDNGVISEVDFESGSRSYLNDQQRLESLKIQIANTRITISTMEGDRDRLLLNDEAEVYTNRQILEEVIQDLKNKIMEWEYNYVIKSPINGKVALFEIWNKYQNVEPGTVLLTVVPHGSTVLIGRVVLPTKNSGKVAVGQKVIIKIDNYPHSEWGSLKGKIMNISSVPKQGRAEYLIQVSINSLTTSFNKRLDFKQEMQGTAEIITEKLTIFQRVFYQMRELLSRN